MRASDFLLPFEETLHIDWQSASGAQIRFESFDVAEQLSLVVGCAACINVSSLHRRIEWRGLPLCEGLSGQYIIVAINKESRAPLGVLPAGIDEWISLGRNDTHSLHADCLQMPRKPVRAFADVCRALRLGTNAGKTQEFLQFGDEPLTASPGVGKRTAWVHVQFDTVAINEIEPSPRADFWLAGASASRSLSE